MFRSLHLRMNYFYSAIASNDYASASHHYNLASLGDRISLFISILPKRDDELINFLLPLTPSNEEIIKCAILSHNQRVLRALYNDNYSENASLTFLAASCGNLIALAFLYEEGCIFSENVADIAVMNAELECLKYIVSIGKCNIDHHTFAMAAKRSTYSYYGMPPSIKTINYRPEQLKVLQYLHDIKCVGDWDCKYRNRVCHFCLNRRDIRLRELWFMNDTNYENSIQWLPNEVLEDVISLII